MGGIFLRRRSRPKVEAINDKSGDVVTFFRVLQRHYPYMIDMLRFRVASRAEFERLKATPPARLTDLERAVRFLYLQRLAFGAKSKGATSASTRHRARGSTSRPLKRLTRLVPAPPNARASYVSNFPIA